MLLAPPAPPLPTAPFGTTGTNNTTNTSSTNRAASTIPTTNATNTFNSTNNKVLHAIMQVLAPMQVVVMEALPHSATVNQKLVVRMTNSFFNLVSTTSTHHD